MAPMSDEERILVMLEKIMEKLGLLESRIAVIEDQNRGQFKELENVKKYLTNLKCRCDKRHEELEAHRHEKHSRLGERVQRVETTIWLLGSTVSILALILGGGILVKLIGS
ncbi:MAG: hypothetical protein HY914_05150 [Desulfomonile tiedjei]|nr:hypothetical protein [Desulfomonile tiedjei]